LKALKAKQDDDGMTVLHYVCLDYEEKGIAMDTSDDDESLNRWETTDTQLEFKNKPVVKPKKRSPQKFDGSPKKEYFADKKPATKEKKGYSYSKKKAVESDKKVKKESYRPDLTFKEQPQAFAFGNKMKKENNQTSFTYNKSDFNNYELQNAFALENKAKKEGNQTSFTFNQPSFTFNQPSFTFNDQPQPFDNKEKKESNQTSFTFNQQPQPFNQQSHLFKRNTTQGSRPIRFRSQTHKRTTTTTTPTSFTHSANHLHLHRPLARRIVLSLIRLLQAQLHRSPIIPLLRFLRLLSRSLSTSQKILQRRSSSLLAISTQRTKSEKLRYFSPSNLGWRRTRRLRN
jgi:hypothetical protein